MIMIIKKKWFFNALYIEALGTFLVCPHAGTRTRQYLHDMASGYRACCEFFLYNNTYKYSVSTIIRHSKTIVCVFLFFFLYKWKHTKKYSDEIFNQYSWVFFFTISLCQNKAHAYYEDDFLVFFFHLSSSVWTCNWLKNDKTSVLDCTFKNTHKTTHLFVVGRCLTLT